MIKERRASAASGYLMLLVVLGLFAGAATAAVGRYPVGLTILLAVAGIVALCGFFTVHPNKAVVLQIFGRYVGTVKDEGLRWANPLYSKRHLSLRTRNFETSRLKVNDLDGNPIEIGAVVVWKVVDSAEASFQVDNYEHYVTIQSESALRTLATHYAYDSHEVDGISLRANTDEIATRLRHEIQERLAVAGVAVEEARISHLAYAPEIAAAMLQRQQASAIVAARQKIVEGAVGMVEMALEMLNQRQVITLDEERKAAMVSNLLVVLCGERNTQPVVNAGTLHH
ncbi:MAG TPA: SPFH domain-containing protein [Bryobacteraceae bacterium]|nr:SPFH domain-containing protein [Bryobacteraceae bacterium]